MSEFDFSGAFKHGIEAALKAEASRMEILGVIKDLSRQINVATGGLLEIEIREYSPPDPIFNYFGFAKLALVPQFESPQREEIKAKSSLWISARNVKSTEDGFVRLAQWERPHEGYPCTVTVAGREHRCHDKEALQNTLATMLSDAWVGEKLRELLNRPRKPESGSPPSTSEASR